MNFHNFHKSILFVLTHNITLNPADHIALLIYHPAETHVEPETQY